MWDQLKQAKELYKLQNELKNEKIEMEERGVKIIINGKMEVERVELNEHLSKEEQEGVVKDCFNGAMKKIQMLVAQKMQSLR
jgi:DNA-binding protein YbaB